MIEKSDMTKYKTEWNEYGLNEDFWNEVLCNRKIVKVNFDEVGIKSLLLDSGEEVFLLQDRYVKSVLYVKLGE